MLPAFIDFLLWIIGISSVVIGFNIILIAILEYACADRFEES